MDSESRESPPLLHMYVPPREAYAGGLVLERFSEDVTIVKESLLSRAAFLVLAATIGVLSSLFLYWFLQPLLREEFRFDIKKWLVVGGAAMAASAGLLFSHALTLRTLCRRPIRLDRGRGT